MHGVDKKAFEAAARAWREACNQLSVRITAPFILQVEDSSVECLAFLPDFGGRDGMVILGMDLPEIKPDDAAGDLARRKGLFFSFVNAGAFAGRSVAERVFKEALEDWGYYGPRQARPGWFDGYDHSRE